MEGRIIGQKNSYVWNSNVIARSGIIGVFLSDASALYEPIHAIK